MLIKVAARISPLSQAQVKEVEEELNKHIACVFESTYVESLGDLDLNTPLTDLGKTDFFTQKIDELVISKTCDIAIHSAKDLPEIIPDDLEIIAITKGVDSRDSFVSYKYNLENFIPGGIVGVCSQRRIEALKSICPKALVKNIRGTVNDRLDALKKGAYDALILAEAGLIRLKSDAPRTILEIETAPFQGQLAIVARKDQKNMKELFQILDTRVCGLSAQ
jgi:hydroxymethylbilane synthase